MRHINRQTPTGREQNSYGIEIGQQLIGTKPECQLSIKWTLMGTILRVSSHNNRALRKQFAARSVLYYCRFLLPILSLPILSNCS